MTKNITFFLSLSTGLLASHTGETIPEIGNILKIGTTEFEFYQVMPKFELYLSKGVSVSQGFGAKWENVVAEARKIVQKINLVCQNFSISHRFNKSSSGDFFFNEFIFDWGRIEVIADPRPYACAVFIKYIPPNK